MRHSRLFATLALATGLMAGAPGSVGAAQPEQLPQKTFAVRVEGGVVDVSFALALSEVSNYPVTITAIGGPLEEVLWEGVLSEGIYRLRAPLAKITSGTLKVVLKTKVVNRDSAGSQSSLRYLVWEGPYN